MAAISDLTYTPLLEGGLTGSSWGILSAGSGQVASYTGGPATTFQILPSIWHAYQIPAELECDQADAHFEIRQELVTGDPSWGYWVVEDLVHGLTYTTPPWGFPFSDPLPTAIILGGPGAGDIPGPTMDGPWASGIIPIIRIDGDLSQLNTSFGTELRLGGNTSNRQTAWWATGGEMYSGGGLGKPAGLGVPLRAKIVGKNAGKVDKIQSIGIAAQMGGDTSYGMEDVTFSNLTIYSTWFGYSFNISSQLWIPSSGTQVIQGNQGDVCGRLRAYDCHIEGNPIAQDPESYFGTLVTQPPGAYQAGGTFGGYGARHGMRVQASAAYDFRRVTYAGFQEHCNYVDLINGRSAASHPALGGLTWSGWTDCEMLGVISRTFLQCVDRAWESYFRLGAAFPAAYKAKGVVLVDRCILLENPGENAALVTCVGHMGSFVVRDITHTAGKTSSEGHRSMLCWEDGDLYGGASLNPLEYHGNPTEYHGTRYIEASGCHTREFVIIDPVIDVDHCEDESHIAMQGVENLRIYGFSITNAIGPKASISLDGGIQYDAGIQLTEGGVLAYMPLLGPEGQPLAPGEGTPLSNNGLNKASNANVGLYFNYPNPASAASTWGGGDKIRHYLTPGSSSYSVLTDPQIDALAVAPDVLPDGLSISGATGLISGVPTTPGAAKYYGVKADDGGGNEAFVTIGMQVLDGGGATSITAALTSPPGVAVSVLPVSATLSGLIVNPGGSGGDPGGHPGGGGNNDPSDPAIGVAARPRLHFAVGGWQALHIDTE